MAAVGDADRHDGGAARPGVDAVGAGRSAAPLSVAALYVETNGCYYNLPGVDPWDKARDARLYAGPWPVVAHPPCQRWCRLAGLVQVLRAQQKPCDLIDRPLRG